MTIDLTEIIVAVITLCGIIITTFGVPYIKANTSAKEQQTMFEWARIFVSAVEEMHRAGLLKGAEAKFNKVMELLVEKGYTFDTEASKAVITGKVWELINQFKDDEVKVGGSE